MSSSSFAAPVAALDHPIMSKMMKELVAASDPLEGYALAPTTYTSVLSSDKYNDEHHRYWYVACQVAQTHFGVSLPDPLRSCDDASATPAQATAAKEIHECYLEGLEDVMMRFYNLGFSRVSTATHRYALDFSLWMRGYALYVGCGDYGPQFSYTKPLDFVAPFSQEYDDFHRHRRAQEAPLNPIASTITTGSMPHDRPQEAPPKPIASTITTGSMPTAKPSSGLNKPNPTSANTDQPPRRETRPAPPATSATRAHSLSAAQPSRGGNKRTVDESDAMALAPPSKRPQPGPCLRALARMGLLGGHEVHLPSQAEQQSQATTVPTVPGSSAQAGRRRRPARLCGNKACQSPNHELADCFGPVSDSGFLDGCPLHNTEEHLLDNCPHLPWVTKYELFDFLVTRRANLPPIQTAISLLALAATMGKLDVLAETMPLDRTTVKDTYVQMRMWENPDRSRLFRDPKFPSDPQALMEKLYDCWYEVVSRITRMTMARCPPQDLTLFKREWITELVPYSKIYEVANVNVPGRGVYPFAPKAELINLQKQHREMFRKHLINMRKEPVSSRRRRN